MTLEQLKAPPIAEVVCGVAFDSIQKLDTLSIGWYALDRETDYPTRQIQPVIADPGVFLFGPANPIRAWLVSADGVFIVQVQHDRFFMNWRANGTRYPRFNEHNGQPGVLQRMLDEFDRFTKFCIDRLGATPRVRKTELTKIDHLVSGQHWNSSEDLGTAVPSLAPLLRLPPGEKTSATFSLTSRTSLGQLHVTVATRSQPFADAVKDVVVFDSRSIGEAASAEVDIRGEMIARNNELNELFMRLIPVQERAKRFGGETK